MSIEYFNFNQMFSKPFHNKTSEDVGPSKSPSVACQNCSTLSALLAGVCPWNIMVRHPVNGALQNKCVDSSEPATNRGGGAWCLQCLGNLGKVWLVCLSGLSFDGLHLMLRWIQQGYPGDSQVFGWLKQEVLMYCGFKAFLSYRTIK